MRGRQLRALQDHARCRLVRGQGQGLVEQRLVRHRRGAVSMPHDADRITFGWASSMRTASSSAANPPNTTECTAPSRAHASIADDRLGDHRHGQHHPVPGAHAEPGERPGEAGDLVEELGVGEGALGPGDRADVDQRGLVAAAGLDVAVQGVEAGVQPRVGVPAVDRRGRCRRARRSAGWSRRSPPLPRPRSPPGPRCSGRVPARTWPWEPPGSSVSAQCALRHGTVGCRAAPSCDERARAVDERRVEPPGTHGTPSAAGECGPWLSRGRSRPAGRRRRRSRCRGCRGSSWGSRGPRARRRTRARPPDPTPSTSSRASGSAGSG